jgi:hypothetical protein
MVMMGRWCRREAFFFCYPSVLAEEGREVLGGVNTRIGEMNVVLQGM